MRGRKAICLGFVFLGFAATIAAAGFKDIPKGHWAAGAVDEVTKQGFLKGKGKEKFEGANPLSRYEAAVLIRDLLGRVQQLEGRIKALESAKEEVVPSGAALKHDEFRMNGRDPRFSRDPREGVEIEVEPVKSEPTAPVVGVEPRLVYRYERLIGPLNSDARDDFRGIIEEEVGGQPYSLVLQYEDSWGEKNTREDLRALAFTLTVVRKNEKIQENRSRKFSLEGLRSGDILHIQEMKPFSVTYRVLDIFREQGKVRRVRLGVTVMRVAA